MTEKSKERIKGYGAGNVETVISVDEVVRRTAAIAEEISPNQLDNLADGKPYVSLENWKRVTGRCGYSMALTCALRVSSLYA